MLYSGRMLQGIVRALGQSDYLMLQKRVQERDPEMGELLREIADSSEEKRELTDGEFLNMLVHELGSIAESDGFKARVTELMRQKNVSDKTVYDAIRMGKTTWYNHMGRKQGNLSEHTNRRNLFALCLVLRLSYYEAVWFLGCSGIQFSRTPLDAAVAFCLRERIYDPDGVAEVMERAGVAPLDFSEVDVRDDGPAPEDVLLDVIVDLLSAQQIKHIKASLQRIDLELYAPFCALMWVRDAVAWDAVGEPADNEATLARRIREIALRKGIQPLVMYTSIGMDNKYFMRRSKERSEADGIMREKDRLMFFRLCLALQLSYEEAVEFLQPLGITFSAAALDHAVASLLQRGIYDPVKIEEVLYDGGLPPLLSEE